MIKKTSAFHKLGIDRQLLCSIPNLVLNGNFEIGMPVDAQTGYSPVSNATNWEDGCGDFNGLLLVGFECFGVLWLPSFQTGWVLRYLRSLGELGCDV